MEEVKQKKVNVSSLILVIIGICLIVAGIFVPRIVFRGPLTFSSESRSSGMYFDVEIETKKDIDPYLAYGYVDIYAIDEVIKYRMIVNEEDSNGEYYKFEIKVDNRYRSVLNEVSRVEIYTNSGEMIVFENEDNVSNFGNTSGKIVLTTFMCFTGFVFFMIAFVNVVAKKSSKHIKKAQQAVVAAIFGSNEENAEEKVEEIETITCRYCGIDNDSKNPKCEYCGAPLIKKRKKSK